jgi:rhodanese-related sulfurtransferase
MRLSRLSLTFPVTNRPTDLEPALRVFHRFIQRGLVEGLILDVADYRHVPTGPGVRLVGHDIDYGVNEESFTVVRKRCSGDPVATQLRDALRMGLGAMAAIDEDGELDVAFDRSRFTLAAPERRLGPREQLAAELLAAVEPELTQLYGRGVTVGVVASDDAREPARLLVEAAPSVAEDVLDTLGGSQAPGQSPWDISVEELARWRENEADFVLVDVREESEYETVSLGGRLIPLATLGERIDELDRDARIVVHCRAGHRGATAVEQLRDAGFTDAWNLNGALVAWRERIDPTLTQY